MTATPLAAPAQPRRAFVPSADPLEGEQDVVLVLCDFCEQVIWLRRVYPGLYRDACGYCGGPNTWKDKATQWLTCN